MPYIDPAVVAEVKQIDLLSYLQRNDPTELVKIGNGVYCTRSHDSLKVTDKGLWHWFSRDIGGRTALDYLIKVKGMQFTDAVMKITGQEINSFPASDYVAKKKLLLPEKHTDNVAVTNYLANVRCLDPDIVNQLIRKGLIYESKFGSNTNAVFVGVSKDGVPKQASIRGVMSLYKTEAIGSNKHFAFNIPAKNGSDTIRVFEGAIDLMSFMTLSKIHRNPIDEHLISLSGIYKPKEHLEESLVPVSIEQYIQDHKGISNVVLHLDNDRAGRLSAESLIIALPKIGLSVTSNPPRKAKDFNDYLRLTVKDKAPKEKEREK
jgi:hypothetical protein